MLKIQPDTVIRSSFSCRESDLSDFDTPKTPKLKSMFEGIQTGSRLCYSMQDLGPKLVVPIVYAGKESGVPPKKNALFSC